MDIRELTIEKRDTTGKQAAKRLRRNGRIPAILYGGAAPVSIAVDGREILRLMHGHEGGTQLLRVSFKDDGDARMAIIRDMQLDPVSDDVIHVDLQEVRMDRAIQVAVPLRHVGEPLGVRESKGILEMILREVQVSCLPGAIPEWIDCDVSPLDIHDVLTVGNLTVPEGVRILTDPGQAVATVAPPMAEEVVAPVVAAAPAAAPAEPEVLTERKPKEEGDEKKK
ncbi:MAG: 50S ribosomal protein L25 [Candidatus Rokubacteria bacterium]|nr:50S ribosomal protein L25 [Candidatus Rokubacteria bacterium]